MADTNEGPGRRVLLDVGAAVLLVFLVAGVYWYDRAEIRMIGVRGLWNLHSLDTPASQLAATTGEDPRARLAHTPSAADPKPPRPLGPAPKGLGRPRPATGGQSSRPSSPKATPDSPVPPAAESPAKPVQPPPVPAPEKKPLKTEITAAGLGSAAETQSIPPETAAAELLQAALVLHQLGDLSAARDELGALVEQFPGTPAAVEGRRRLPEIEAALAERQCEDVLRLAAETHAAGKLTETRQMLLAVIQGCPASRAVGEAKSRLQAVIQEEEEQRSQTETAARQRALTKQAEADAAAAQLLKQAIAAQEKEDLIESQRLLNLIAKDYAGTPAARDARRVERAVDAAQGEKKTAQMLEQAKLAHQEGRFTEARRLLERIAQDRPNTPASKEAANLILQVMAAARQQKDAAVVKYREPAAPVRPTPPRPRETASTSTVRDAGGRERDKAAGEEQNLTKYRQPAPPSRRPPPPEEEIAKTSERIPKTNPPKTPSAAAVLTPDPKARDKVAQWSEQVQRQKTEHGNSPQPQAKAKE